jgi:hypothetical protein
MTLKSILGRLSYPHKLSAIPYFLLDPRLVLGIQDGLTGSHICSVVERATKGNAVAALHSFLPGWFQSHIESAGLRDKGGVCLVLYLLVRKFRPAIVVETGVARGLSSAYILCAMQENRHGQLYSIDLPCASASARPVTRYGRPAYQLEDGQVQGRFEVGYFVPECVRRNWTLVLGDSRTELPPLLERLGHIDMFLHDSLHTYEHMQWEYETAWPYINDDGFLLSHDVLWNRALFDKCRSSKAKPVIYRTLGILGKTLPSGHGS